MEQQSSWRPAPYGQACAGCVRAKCKCFIRAGGSACERCQRLDKTCESSGTVRKRRVRRQYQQQQQQQQQQSTSSFTQIEHHLDEVVSLLRRQTEQRQQPPAASSTVGGGDGYGSSERFENEGDNTPSATATSSSSTYVRPKSPTRAPELRIDANNSHLHMSRLSIHGDDALSESQVQRHSSSSPIYKDVLRHEISEAVAMERLDMFRAHFLPMFPFVHIPTSLHPFDLRRQKPFLWLLIMCLAAPAVDEQFRIEDTIWEIIGKRVIAEHHASLDLVLGLIAFSAWSHYFKNDKPFMTTITGLAVSMAFDLNLHKRAPPSRPLRPDKQLQQDQGSLNEPFGPGHHDRSLEERRTFIALFHVSSATWTAYRKTEPLKRSAYLTECMRIIGEGTAETAETQTRLDKVLVSQVKCQILDTQLTRSITDDLDNDDDDDDYDGQGSGGGGNISVVVLKGMLDNIADIQHNLQGRGNSGSDSTELYLLGTKLTIQDFILRARPSRNGYGHGHNTSSGINLQRLKDLDATLALAERWMAVWFRDPVPNLRGTTVDIFTHFLHSLVILFKLSTIDEAGWDAEEMLWRRGSANVFAILDRASKALDLVASTLGLVDSTPAVSAPFTSSAFGEVDADNNIPRDRRHGLFFKTQYLLRAIKTVFLAELEPDDRLMAMGMGMEKYRGNGTAGGVTASSKTAAAVTAATTTNSQQEDAALGNIVAAGMTVSSGNDIEIESEDTSLPRTGGTEENDLVVDTLPGYGLDLDLDLDLDFDFDLVMKEPWLADIYNPSWDGDSDVNFDVDFDFQVLHEGQFGFS